MKIEDVTIPDAERLLKFFEEHADEVFRLKELSEVFGKTIFNSQVRALYYKGKIDRLRIGNIYYYGSHKAIRRLACALKKQLKR